MVHDADTSANAHQPRFAATVDMGQNLWHPPAGPDEKCTQAQVWCTVQRLLSREYAPVSVDTNLESEEDAISISEWSECCLDLLHAIVKVGQLLDYDIQIEDVKTSSGRCCVGMLLCPPSRGLFLVSKDNGPVSLTSTAASTSLLEIRVASLR
jgi:hypothetical protein